MWAVQGGQRPGIRAFRQGGALSRMGQRPMATVAARSSLQPAARRAPLLTIPVNRPYLNTNSLAEEV
jgi:hypothetical protein